MTNNQLPTPTPPKSIASPAPVPALPKMPQPPMPRPAAPPTPVAPSAPPAPVTPPMSQAPVAQPPQPVSRPPLPPQQLPRPLAPPPRVASPTPQPQPQQPQSPLQPPAIPHLPPRPPVPQSMPGRPPAPVTPLTSQAPGAPATPVAAAAGMPPRPPQAQPQSVRPPVAQPTQPAQPPRPPMPPQAVPQSPQPAQNPASPASAPKVAQVSKSPFRFLPFILGGLVLVGVIGFFVLRFLGGARTTPVNTDPSNPTNTNPRGAAAPVQQTTLTYWGLWEPTDVMAQIFTDFEDANPGISVNYVKQSHLDYRERLQSSISQGTGPDVFRFHASWTPMLRDDLTAVPSTIYSNSAFQNTFYPVAAKQLQYNSQLRGIPLMYDGLALYYNEDMLKAANAEVPKTWADLRILASRLTVKSAGSVERAGLAIGNASNVEHFADILGLLLLQNGADLTNPTSSQAQDALVFYTDFMKEYGVWSEALPNSTVAFARGDVAMMFAPSWRAHEILAQNPDLKFGIAPVPKLGNSQVAWATFWAEGVNSKSKNKEAAWKLLAYLSSSEVMKKMYGEQSTVRRFGELYSRQDLANELKNEPLAVSFLSDAPNAAGWYMSSFTHDNGINDQIIKYYEDAVNAVLSGTAPDKALETVATGVAQVLRQYGVATTAKTTTPGVSQQ